MLLLQTRAHALRTVSHINHTPKDEATLLPAAESSPLPLTARRGTPGAPTGKCICKGLSYLGLLQEW